MPVEDEEISAKSKNRHNPLRKVFRRKPSAKELLEKALAERRNTVHPQQPQQQQANVIPPPVPPIVPKPRTTRTLDQRTMKRSFLTRTKFFKDMTAAAFEVIDADGSGEVDEKELYSGLLLIHLKLGTYAGPAACRVSHCQVILTILPLTHNTCFGSICCPCCCFS
jgi:hypothetical protein